MKKLKDKAAVLYFLKSHALATISTVNNKTLQPESALVAFAELDDLEILFLTLKESRKAQNLLDNNKVAMVIGWDRDPSRWSTLQYEGKAFPVEGTDELKYRKIFLNKKDTPCTEEFFQMPGMKLYKITPTWIGYARYQGESPRIIEIQFPSLVIPTSCECLVTIN